VHVRTQAGSAAHRHAGLQLATGTLRRPFSHTFVLVRNPDNANAFSIAQELYRTVEARAAAGHGAAVAGGTGAVGVLPTSDADTRSVFVGNVRWSPPQRQCERERERGYGTV
jgi:hypothetical protein